MPAALFDNPQPRINQYHGKIRRGSARDHVARVLNMAGSIGDDEFAAGRREIAIGNIDGDALLALGPEAIGEVGEIDLAAAGDVGGALQRLELVLHQAFGIKKQPADERRFAVVNRAAGVKPQDFDRMVGCRCQNVKIPQNIETFGVRHDLVIRNDIRSAFHDFNVQLLNGFIDVKSIRPFSDPPSPLRTLCRPRVSRAR